MFEFEYSLNEDDFFEFNKYHFLHNKVGKKNILVLKCLVPIVSLAFLFILYIIGEDYELIVIEGIILTTLSLFALIFAKKNSIKNLERTLKKAKKSGKLFLGGQVLLKFENDQIIEISQDTESKVKYKLLEKIVVADQAIYLYISAFQASILPLYVFESEQQKQDFLKYIKSKIK